jgi:hypothetical protein
MKVGDIVHMPEETIREGENPSIGIVIHDKDTRTHTSWAGKSKRIGILWACSNTVEWEPLDWLEVISDS